MNKIKFLLIGLLLFIIPTFVKAETCTNCITLSENQSIEAGATANLSLTTTFSSTYANKIKKIEYTLTVTDTNNLLSTPIENRFLDTLVNWGSSNSSGVYVYTKGNSTNEVVNGDKITSFTLKASATAIAGSTATITISNVKYFYDADDPSSPGSTIETVVNGTGSTRTISIKEKESQSSIVKSKTALLDTLVVSQGTLTPVFDPTKEIYNIALKDTITKITITTTCKENCSVLSLSADGTAIGSSSNGSYKTQVVLIKNEIVSVKITVISQDGENAKNYTVNIARGDVVNDMANLKSLTIDEGTLTPVFDPNVMEYAMEVDSDVSSLDIHYEALHTDATTEQIGGSNLIIGENIVKINVTSADSSTTKSYIITVTKKDLISSDTNSSETATTDTDNKINTKTLLIILIIIFVALAIISIAFYLIFKKKKEDKIIENTLNGKHSPDVKISHENDQELLELTKEFNIQEEIKKSINTNDKFN